MPAPSYSSANFLRAFQALLPRGRVWPRDQDAVVTKTLAGLAPSYERNAARAVYLLQDAFPGSTSELLPEWEATLGLPDPCAGEAPTIQQRRAQVVARLANGGGQSIPHFVNFVAQLGYTVTISQFAPFRVGHRRAGDQVGTQDWAFTWQINSALNTITSFRAGVSGVGEPLRAWGNAVLECEVGAIKPAHTLLNFAYH
jgi:uncharacterized protein YmfQ (DUF2313 family)